MNLDILRYSRQITKKNIPFIRKLIASNPDKNRRFVSRELSRQSDWTQQNTAFEDVSCRRHLSQFQLIRLLTLPPPQANTLWFFLDWKLLELLNGDVNGVLDDWKLSLYGMPASRND